MRIIIIGNGISGATAARFIRKWSDHSITMISAESDYFFSRTALMYVYMGDLRLKDTRPYPPEFWKKNNIQLIKARVTGFDKDTKTVALDTGQQLSYDKLIIATGSTPRFFGWPGQELEGVRGLYSLQDLEYIEKYSKDLKRAVVVGGGLIGIELAEMLHSRGIPLTFLVREKHYWDNILPPEESAMVTRHILDNGIDLRLDTALQSIIDNGTGRVEAVQTDKGEQIKCGFVGITTGVQPNIDWIRNSELECEHGILVDDQLQTNLPDVYAIGDCAQLRQAQPGRKAIEAVWYTGRMMGETLAFTICKKPKAYRPGIWFNSAKFFHLEYQVYGSVPASLPTDQDTLYWEHPDGKKSLRINFYRSSQVVSGFQAMGIRLRHEVCEKWLKNEALLEEVLPNLALANFDPEFYRRHEKDIVKLFNQRFGKNIRLQPRQNILNKVYQFLKS